MTSRPAFRTALLLLIVLGGCGGKLLDNGSSGAGGGRGQGGTLGSAGTAARPPIGAAGDFISGTGGFDVGGAGGAFIGTAGAFGAGGAFIGAGGGSLGAGGTAIMQCNGPTAIQTPISTTICNFENGLQILAVASPGWWYAYNDGTPGSLQQPQGNVLMASTPLNPPRDMSLQGLQTYGKGFFPSGAASFGGGVGFAFTQPGSAIDPGPFIGGITFWAKGAGPMKVQVLTTHVVPDFCECMAAGCYNAHEAIIPLASQWQFFTVGWNDLSQEPWGYQVPFDQHAITGINFASNGPTDWNFWIDDISFFLPGEDK
jgi:hypothetical protein